MIIEFVIATPTISTREGELRYNILLTVSSIKPHPTAHRYTISTVLGSTKDYVYLPTLLLGEPGVWEYARVRPTISQQLEVVSVELLFCLARGNTPRTHQNRVNEPHAHQRLLAAASTAYHLAAPTTMVLQR